jgi:hypothetical protein
MSEINLHNFVIPAQAGIQHPRYIIKLQELDSRLRGKDEYKVFCSERGK